MRWIEALRGTPSLWDDFKDWVAEQRARELERLLDCTPQTFERQVGRIEMLDAVLAIATAEEREEHARNLRRERTTDRSDS